MPARMNAIHTPGPAIGTASPRMTRIPVPRVAPTLIMVSWKMPKVRRSSCEFASSVSLIMLVIDLRRPS